MTQGQRVSRYLTHAVVDGGVALVTSAARGQVNVMTASFFAESSHLPVLIRVGISPESLTYALIAESGWFGLSVLCQGQEALAMACGSTSGRQLAKLERLGIRYHLSPNGVPIVRDTLTTSECRVLNTVALADHHLVVGEVVSSFTQTRQSFRDPLLVSELRRYAGVSETTV